MSSSVQFSHGGYSGDVIYGLLTGEQICRDRGAGSAELYIASDRPASLREGMEHPSGPELMSRKAFDFLAPLLRLQPWIREVEFVPDARIPRTAIPLDPYRFTPGLNGGAGNIADYPAKIYGLHVDASRPWLRIPAVEPRSGGLTVCLTRRYRNPSIDYSFLQEVPDVRFVGLRDEYEHFCRRAGLSSVEYHPCRDAVELATAIGSARAFLGNQSFTFAVAEALKVPRLLETCEIVPNVVPCGPGASSFINQAGLVNLLRRWGVPLGAGLSSGPVHSPAPAYTLYLAD